MHKNVNNAYLKTCFVSLGQVCYNYTIRLLEFFVSFKLLVSFHNFEFFVHYERSLFAKINLDSGYGDWKCSDLFIGQISFSCV